MSTQARQPLSFTLGTGQALVGNEFPTPQVRTQLIILFDEMHR